MAEAGHLPDSALNEYLDGVPEGRAEAEAHLAGCPECAARLAELRGLFAALAALPDAQPERDLAPAVARAIRPAPQAALPLAVRTALALQALAAAIVGAGAWPVFTRTTAAEQAAFGARAAAQAIGAAVAAGLAELEALLGLPARLGGEFASLGSLPLHWLSVEGWLAMLAGLIVLGGLGNLLVFGLARSRLTPYSRSSP